MFLRLPFVRFIANCVRNHPTANTNMVNVNSCQQSEFWNASATAKKER